MVVYLVFHNIFLYCSASGLHKHTWNSYIFLNLPEEVYTVQFRYNLHYIRLLFKSKRRSKKNKIKHLLKLLDSRGIPSFRQSSLINRKPFLHLHILLLVSLPSTMHSEFFMAQSESWVQSTFSPNQSNKRKSLKCRFDCNSERCL